MITTNYDIYVSLIKAIEAQLDDTPPKVIKSHDTLKGIGLDSMDMLCIMCDIETEYNINIPDNIVSLNDTIGKIAETIFCLTFK